MERKYFIICLVFAFWTVIQTGLHLVGIMYAFFLRICHETPTDSRTILFYLTYLYNKDCATPKLVNYTSSPSSSLQSYVLHIVDNIYIKETHNVSLDDIIKDLLDHIDYFPENAASSERASMLLLSFISLDGAWIVAAVALLMGVFFDIRESLSLFFFGPWLVLTACVCIFDAVASVFFGFDIVNTINFNSWITFVGVTDESKFDDFLDKNQSFMFSVIPSLVFCSISSRFVLIWLSNWLGFILVMKATISVYHESYKNEISNRHRSSELSAQRNRTDHNTSADRIRNWQLFYGAINTTRSDTSENNSNNSAEGQSESRSSADSRNNSGGYLGYTDVAESVVVGESGKCIEELRGQLPWSYIRPQDEGRGRSSGEEIELESRAKRHLRIKSDSSGSATEL